MKEEIYKIAEYLGCNKGELYSEISKLLNSQRDEIIGEIKKSFIEEFFKSGKRWYNFIFKDEEEKNDALKIVENEWKDIITKIKSKYE